MPNGFEAYERAHRLGMQAYEKDKEQGKDPYLPVLDRILEHMDIKRESQSVTREIPLNMVVGTRTEGRTQAFASNFMPLLEPGTEFADKWASLYKSQMTEGIREPIKAYELFGRYYVQEGNKRVSVLKFCQASTIMADVREIVVEADDLEPEQAALYKAAQDFQKAVPLKDLIMSKPRNYIRLMKLFKATPEQPLDPEKVRDVKSLYVTFTSALEKLGLLDKLNQFDYLEPGKNDAEGRPTTTGDAFVQYLKSYGFSWNAVVPQSEMIRELTKMYDLNPLKNGVYVMTDTEGSDRPKGILSSILTGPLKVAFICANNAKSSAWTAEHLEAVEKVKKDLGNDISVSVYENANTPDEVKKTIEKAIQEGNEVIFTTSPSMLQQANQTAANYPRLKVLNNSLNLDTGLLRTYYAREYEVQFLLGLLAGVLTKSGRIGYMAGYPILGTVASINAFAIGVEMTNPDAKVYLDWTTTQETTLHDPPLGTDILYIEGNRFDTTLVEDRKYGLFDVGRGKFFNIAKIKTNWAVFYEKILRSILNNTWSLDQQKSGSESINYWWGMSNGLLELEFSDKLPLQARRLAEQLQQDMTSQKFMPFEGPVEDQDHVIHDGTKGIFMPDVARMDWLCSNIVGVIPKVSMLMDNARKIATMHGVKKTREIE